MIKKNYNILHDFYKKKIFLKNEIKKIILKNIIFNKNINPELRMFAKIKIQKINKNNYISKQNNNICIKTGKIKSVYNMTNFSRHYMKKLAISNNLQNIKISNW